MSNSSNFLFIKTSMHSQRRHSDTTRVLENVSRTSAFSDSSSPVERAPKPTENHTNIKNSNNFLKLPTRQAKSNASSRRKSHYDQQNDEKKTVFFLARSKTPEISSNRITEDFTSASGSSSGSFVSSLYNYSFAYSECAPHHDDYLKRTRSTKSDALAERSTHPFKSLKTKTKAKSEVMGTSSMFSSIVSIFTFKKKNKTARNEKQEADHQSFFDFFKSAFLKKHSKSLDEQNIKTDVEATARKALIQDKSVSERIFILPPGPKLGAPMPSKYVYDSCALGK